MRFPQFSGPEKLGGIHPDGVGDRLFEVRSWLLADLLGTVDLRQCYTQYQTSGYDLLFLRPDQVCEIIFVEVPREPIQLFKMLRSI